MNQQDNNSTKRSESQANDLTFRSTSTLACHMAPHERACSLSEANRVSGFVKTFSKQNLKNSPTMIAQFNGRGWFNGHFSQMSDISNYWLNNGLAQLIFLNEKICFCHRYSCEPKDENNQCCFEIIDCCHLFYM